jgi:hypothetical protein
MFPGRYAAFGGPFEESWVYEINRLTAESGWRGTAFSYGPLGFLLYPRDIGVNLLVAIGFYLFVHLLFAALISYHAIRAASRLSVFLFVAGYTLAAALGLQGLGYEYHLLIVYGLLLAVRPKHQRAQFANAWSGGMLAAMLLFLKFNLGLCALGMLVVRCLTDRLPASAPRAWSLEALHRRLFPAVFTSAHSSRQTWRVALGAAVGYLLSIVGIGLAYLGPGDFPNWLRFSVDIASQYSVALSLAGPRDLTYLALLGIAVYLVTAIWLGRRDPALRAPLWLFTVLIAFAFKGGFVRQGGQDAMFFPTVIAVLSALPLLSRGARLPQVNGLSLVLTIALALPAATYHRDLSRLKYPDVLDLLVGQRGWEQIRSLLHLSDLRRDLAGQSAANLLAMRLPAPWLARFEGRTVNVIPSGHVLCAANRLHCPPTPLLQLYTGGSQAIDRWNAAYYQGPAAPDYLIVQFGDIDGRHPLWGVPATWQAILRRYRPVEALPEKNLLLLVRTEPVAAVPAPTVFVVTTIRVQQWCEVPISDRPLLAGFDLRLGWWGWLRKLLFRIPAVTIDLETRSGVIRTYRMIPGSAASGLLLNYLPADLTSMNQLFEGRFPEEDQIVRYRLSGFGSAYFEPRVGLTWYELNRPISVFSGTAG